MTENSNEEEFLDETFSIDLTLGTSTGDTCIVRRVQLGTGPGIYIDPKPGEEDDDLVLNIYACDIDQESLGLILKVAGRILLGEDFG